MARRIPTRIVFGEGDQRWSMTDPTDERVQEERHELRYGERPLYHAASLTDDLVYLLLDCPTTKLACAKLRQMRRALHGKDKGDAE